MHIHEVRVRLEASFCIMYPIGLYAYAYLWFKTGRYEKRQFNMTKAERFMHAKIIALALPHARIITPM